MKNIKKIIGSALLATSFAVLSVGTTFALFTDDAKTTINVGSGKVDIGLTTDHLKLYSADSENTGSIAGTITDGPFAGTYYYKEMTNNFANGGSASLSGGNITITNMTPGDRITFDVALADESNVNIKYRLVLNTVKTIGQADKMLAKGLEVTTDLITGTSAKYEKLEKYVSNWESHTYNSLEPLSATYHFDIVLPLNAGNEYQNKGVEYSLSVQAVQGNAVTNNDDAGTFYFLIHEQEVVENQPTVLEASNSDNSIVVNTVIPASEGLDPGSTVELVVSDVDVQSATESTTLNFDVSLYVDGEKKSEFNEDVNVQIYVGPGLDILTVYHKGILMDQSTYVYDINTGIISFTTQSFSPFSVTYREHVREPDTSLGFADSILIPDNELEGDANIPDHYEHHINSVAMFRKLPEFLGNTGSNSDGVKYADKYTVYVLDTDLNFNDEPVWTNEQYSIINGGREFAGTLKGADEGVEISHVAATITDQYGPVFFKSATNASFENLTFSNITISGNKGVGILLAQQPSGANTATSSLLFKNITIESNVTVTSNNGNTGALAGDARNYAKITIDNCTNNGTVSSKTNVGGFIGSSTLENSQVDRYIYLNKVTNNGNITGTDLVGGIIGYAGNLKLLSATNVLNTGTITGTAWHSSFKGGISSVCALVKGTPLSFTNVSNRGMIYLASAIAGTYSSIDAAIYNDDGFRGDDPSLVLDADIEPYARVTNRADYINKYVKIKAYLNASISGVEVYDGTSNRGNTDVKVITVTVPEEVRATATRASVVGRYARHNVVYDNNTVNGSGTGPFYNIDIELNGSATFTAPRVLYSGHTWAKNLDTPSSTLAGKTNWTYERYHVSDAIINDNSLESNTLAQFADGSYYFLVDNRNVDSGYFYVLPEWCCKTYYDVYIYAGDNLVATGTATDMDRFGTNSLLWSIAEKFGADVGYND